LSAVAFLPIYSLVYFASLTAVAKLAVLAGKEHLFNNAVGFLATGLESSLWASLLFLLGGPIVRRLYVYRRS